ncbi:SusC/RagA family TonB-linked outer membrane protein [Pedobacter nutrimenti]|uniref:TonB-linked SusC/RagA family outer membrane protein n=1 Tax=Pedobacter nutrimenti TaxID=1241337 RepID=A0A318UEF4_9SPHI|nr:SusC/RagA family TonB-linked outer membrane protein [Pedobacter nutrimenti]PYF74453.1 TonB-linked SusC/RagA family outer membrane protein [Pedobacter nutrimenti]
MKKLWFLTILVLLTVFFGVSRAQSPTISSKKITFGAEGIMLKDAFEQVEKLTGLSINYNNSQLNDKRIVRLNKAERTIEETLNLLLSGTLFTFKQSNDRNILIVARPKSKGKITGKVLDEQGQPLPGASVKVLGADAYSQCQNDGSYSLSVVPGSYTVEISFISYETFRKENLLVQADKNTVLNTSLQPSAGQLNEVVVTALGIKREEKSLGYSATVVKGEQLTDALSNNWTDALSGKVAGLNLVRSNGGPGGSNKIILRGENNLTGTNEALIIVDGVVISQSSGKTTGNGGSGYLSDETPVDFGSGLNDINPEDIEEVTVLKGPGAAALYGLRGANGAIIITTKSGKVKKGIGVTINSNTAFERINRWPDLQYEYGQGVDGDNYYSYNASEDGASTRSTSSAWGPKLNGQLFYQYDPLTHTKSTVRTPWVPYVNDSRKFFETGRTLTNSVTLDGGNDKTSARFSVTNANNKWIIPNTGYDRNSVALSLNQKVSDKLQIAAKVNYNNKSSDNLPSTGYNNQSIMYWYLFWQPSAPISWLKDYWMPGQENLKQSFPFSSYPDNPYLIANEMLNKSTRNGVTGNAQATYSFTKELSLMVRTSLDFSYDERSQQRPFDTEKYKKGMYRTQNSFSREISSDFLLRYNKKINRDFEVSATAGGSMLKNKYIKDELRADSLSYPGVYTLANSAGVLAPYPYRRSYALNSFYGLFTASYKNFLYLDVTGRNDWSSILASKVGTDNVSFFYPSVNGSLILSEWLKLPRAISFAKLRGSVAKVGSSDVVPYLTSFSYNPQVTFPGGLANQTTLGNLGLKPLYTTSYEVGADLRFLNNRITLDVALYKGNTRNQILTSKVDAASGMSNVIVNAGLVRNKGIEIAATGIPVKNQSGLTWTINTTFAANRNEIVELTPGLEQLILQNGPGGRGAVVAVVGGSMGDLYGRAYERAPDGQIIYENGLPVISIEKKYIGNTNPKWKASIGNNFRYKQFSLSFLFDSQYGAVGYSLSAAALAEQGKTKNTLPGRYNGIIGQGVIKNPDGSFRPNDRIADAPNYYTAHYGRDNVEGTTYSTDFIKLREARFDYALPVKLARKFGIQRASVGVYGRDLFTITKWPLFDPEFGTLDGSGDINKGFEYGQFPSTRTFGLNLVIGL